MIGCLTNDVCELVGAFIGDGCASRWGYLIQFTGDATLDKNYFLTFLIPALATINPTYKPSLRVVDTNTLRLSSNCQPLFNLFTRRFGFPIGTKTYTVKIPDEILSSAEPHVKACLRGIFDTDGSIYFDKRTAYTKPYPRIELHMKSPHLLEQVHRLLLGYGIGTCFNDNRTRLHINGFKNCKRFVSTVGFRNKRHIDRTADLK